jgi:hypothetical protein
VLFCTLKRKNSFAVMLSFSFAVARASNCKTAELQDFLSV